MEERAVTPTWRTSSYTANGGGNCVEVGSIPWHKASHSPNGGGECVEVGSTPWRKASYSANGGLECLEAANVPGAILIRDTKDRGAGPVLRVSAETWRAFTASLR
jgi:hypothetical protein